MENIETQNVDFNIILQKFHIRSEAYLKVRINYGAGDECSCFGFPRGATFLFDDHHGIHEYKHRTNYLEDLGILKINSIKEELVTKMKEILEDDYDPSEDEYCYIFDYNDDPLAVEILGYSWCYMDGKVIKEKCNNSSSL